MALCIHLMLYHELTDGLLAMCCDRAGYWGKQCSTPSSLLLREIHLKACFIVSQLHRLIDFRVTAAFT